MTFNKFSVLTRLNDNTLHYYNTYFSYCTIEKLNEQMKDSENRVSFS